MKNPWTQQPVSKQSITYGIGYSIINKKYQLQSEDRDQFEYSLIVKNANKIQELKQKMAIQIIDQQFGDMIDAHKFQQRIEQLEKLENIIQQVLKCLEKCKICVQHNSDTKNFIKQDDSIYINIPFQFKTQFIQVLRQALDKQQELIDPDTQIIKQQQSIKELNEQYEEIQRKYNQVIDLIELIQY